MISRIRLEYVTEVFLAEARKQFARLRPNDENPIKALRDYPEEQRSALMNAVLKSVVASSDKANPHFETWLESRDRNHQ